MSLQQKLQWFVQNIPIYNISYYFYNFFSLLAIFLNLTNVNVLEIKITTTFGLDYGLKNKLT